MSDKKPVVQVNEDDSGKVDSSGSKCKNFTFILTTQVVNSLWNPSSDYDERAQKINSAISAMRGINPKDEIEGMLAAQMVGLHNSAMECMRRAMIKDQTFEGRNYGISQATKLTRSYAALVDSLQKYRGKGQQKMTVEHVHVNAGGQAIIGNVNNSGGSQNTKTEEQPHAKAVNND